MNKLDELISGHAKAMSTQKEVYDVPNPTADERTVRDMLKQRMEQAQQTVRVTDALLATMPDSFLRMPMSMFHTLF